MTPIRNYIGLANSTHDPAIAIVNADGKVLFAEDCERYLQNKRAWSATADDFFRSQKLLSAYCDPGADLVVATTWQAGPLGRYRLRARYLFPLLRDLYVRMKRNKLSREMRWWIDHQVLSAQALNFNTNLYTGSHIALQNHLRTVYETPRTIKRSYYHHLTHAAAACYTSPFDQAACLVVDGYGEDTSVAYYRYDAGRIEPLSIKNTPMAGSLGYFYSAICWLCGFDPYAGEEWKVMGLAAYGKLDPKLYRLMTKCVQVVDGRMVPGEHGFLNPELLEYRRDPSRSPLEAADLAFTGQAYFCDRMFELVRYLHARSGSPNLVLGGGCALNSACNGRIVESSPFERLHVHAAPADNGNALGAAWLAFTEDHPERRGALVGSDPHTALLGSTISAESIAHFEAYGQLRRTELAGPALPRRVAELLADGKIVGWVQGRAEFGPRALGNRSILADPRRADVKERLNAQVKYREEFRPFAPSILHEDGPAYFENYQESPYMERALVFRPEVRARVPGVVHVDNTGRLQTVKRAWNERYYDLIAAFKQLTGVPLILNTSFNVMGKPIIHSLEDAIAVFMTSGIDVLVVGDRIYEKHAAAGAEASRAPAGAAELRGERQAGAGVA
jgi:carbamoyltransferase